MDTVSILSSEYKDNWTETKCPVWVLGGHEDGEPQMPEQGTGSKRDTFEPLKLMFVVPLLLWAPRIHSFLSHRFDQLQTKNVLGEKSQKVPKVKLEFATHVPSTNADSMQMK